MKFVDLHQEYLRFKSEIDSAFDRVKNSGRYLFGDELEQLEIEFAKLIGTKNAVAVGNCTEALLLVLGHIYKRGMPIILPNFGAYPTAVAARHITDNLVYVDVDNSMTIDVNKLSNIDNGIIVCVHLFGNNCRIRAIRDYAKKRNHILVEDCAQSTGSGSGTFGDYSTFSFYPTKPLAAMGDGGMICSNNNLSYFKKARFYGVNDNILGTNSRMDEFQAAVVRAKIPYLKDLNQDRNRIAKYYRQFVNGITINSVSIYHQFPVRFRNRDKVIRSLEKKNIPYMIHYPKHANEIPVLQGRNKSFVGFKINDVILSLPIHPYLTDDEISEVGDFLYEHREEEIK